MTPLAESYFRARTGPGLPSIEDTEKRLLASANSRMWSNGNKYLSREMMTHSPTIHPDCGVVIAAMVQLMTR